MAVVVTRKWSTYVWGDTRAVIEFEVSGVPAGAAGNAAARGAVPFQKGSTFESDSRLVMLNAPEVQGDFGLRKVTCEFTLPNNDPTNPTDPNVNPLDLPARIQWGRSVLLEPTDIDADGNGIRNTAGDPFAIARNKEIVSRTVTITKNVANYDFSLSEAYEGAVNLQTISSGLLRFPPERVKCLSVIPSGDYAADATYVSMALTLEIRIAAQHPFHIPIVSKGRRGWYSVNNGPATSGRITDANYNPVTEDVYLSVTGKPIDTTLKVEGQTPVNNPNVIAGWIQDFSAPGPAVVMLWKQYRLVDFTYLFSQLGI
jgi:hypothetical protein